jgi:hypothetical protein
MTTGLLPPESITPRASKGSTIERGITCINWRSERNLKVSGSLNVNGGNGGNGAAGRFVPGQQLRGANGGGGGIGAPNGAAGAGGGGGRIAITSPNPVQGIVASDGSDAAGSQGGTPTIGIRNSSACMPAITSVHINNQPTTTIITGPLVRFHFRDPALATQVRFKAVRRACNLRR